MNNMLSYYTGIESSYNIINCFISVAKHLFSNMGRHITTKEILITIIPHTKKNFI